MKLTRAAIVTALPLVLIAGFRPGQPATATPAPAATEGQKAAAFELFDAMKLKDVLGATINQAIDAQTKTNPMLSQFRNTLANFMNKYMSYDAIKDDLASIYASEFSESELKELTKFYSTPLGQKLAAKQPTLSAKGMALGQARMQQHMGELQAAIQAQAAGGGAPTPPTPPALPK